MKVRNLGQSHRLKLWVENNENNFRPIIMVENVRQSQRKTLWVENNDHKSEKRPKLWQKTHFLFFLKFRNLLGKKSKLRFPEVIMFQFPERICP